MRKGFLYNQNKCVACGACSAACVLENRWDFKPRTIYKYNREAITGIPIVNLSLACNHCTNAVCMDGCPAAAYRRDVITGAVVIDETKCIGCKYCQWNCPYDAPKFIEGKKIINKCDFCYSLQAGGLDPACTVACPTGALKFGEISDNSQINATKWLPDKSLKPSLVVSAKTNPAPRVISGMKYSSVSKNSAPEKKILSGEIGLVFFTFLVTLSAALNVNYLIEGNIISLKISASFLLLGGLLSLIHLRSPLTAWRALLNPKRSPLSREILFFIFYFILVTLSAIVDSAVLLFVTIISGLIMLLLIDMVYLYADKRRKVYMHSGQAFFTGLLMISFFTGSIVPFIFMAALKLIFTFSLFGFTSAGVDAKINILRFVRVSLLIIVTAGLMSGVSVEQKVLILLFLMGEFIDRLIYYYDFNPLSVRTLTDPMLKEIR